MGNNNEVFDGSDLFVDAEDTHEAEEQAAADTDTPAEAEDTHEAESQESNNEDAKTEDENEEQGHPPFMTVQFLGKERGLNREEAITFAQKGLDYDHVRQELEELRPLRKEIQEIAPFLQEVDYWAKESGMNRSEYLSFLRENRQAQMLQNEMSGIKTQYPDLPDEVVKEMAELRCKGKEAENVRLEEQQAQAQKDAELAPWQKFIEVYGITDPEKIPPDVMADVGNGLSPVEAMQKHEINELKKQLEAANTKKQIEEKHEENKKRAMPSAATQAQPEKEDSFLAGMGF